MLIPAIIMKNEILDNFKRYFYSDDMMYETGCMNNWLPDIVDCPYEKFDDKIGHQYTLRCIHTLMKDINELYFGNDEE